MNSIKFYFEENQLYAKQYVTTLEKANELAEQIGIHCEIHEEDPEESGFQFSIVWASEDAYVLAHKLKKEGKLSESWLIPDLSFDYTRCLPGAIAPQKAHVMDSGYDIHIIGIKKIDSLTNTIFYHTGIKLRPPFGYYFEMYGRSSLSKTGHMVANNVGIIDSNYRGELIVALKKDPNVPMLNLPFKAVQIIPKLFIHMEAKECESLEETQRNEGGFGSSNGTSLG